MGGRRKCKIPRNNSYHRFGTRRAAVGGADVKLLRGPEAEAAVIGRVAVDDDGTVAHLPAQRVLMNMKININLVNAKPVEDGTMIEATMGFQVQNAEHLDSIIKNLMKINGVKSVSRVRSV